MGNKSSKNRPYELRILIREVLQAERHREVEGGSKKGGKNLTQKETTEIKTMRKTPHLFKFNQRSNKLWIFSFRHS